MKKGKKLYEGKAKIIYSTSDKNWGWITSKAKRISEWI